jgi:hypothetical protein
VRRGSAAASKARSASRHASMIAGTSRCTGFPDVRTGPFGTVTVGLCDRQYREPGCAIGRVVASTSDAADTRAFDSDTGAQLPASRDR